MVPHGFFSSLIDPITSVFCPRSPEMSTYSQQGLLRRHVELGSAVLSQELHAPARHLIQRALKSVMIFSLIRFDKVLASPEAHVFRSV